MKLLIGIAAAALVATAAMAADMPVQAPPPPPPPVETYDWTGFYLSGGLGFMRMRDHWAFVHPAPATLVPFSQSTDVGNIGIFAGNQWQFGSIVIGVEGGVSAPINSRYASTVGGFANGPCSAVTGQFCLSRIGHLDTLGGKLGWAWNNGLFNLGGLLPGGALLYGEGGWARGGIQTQLVRPGTLLSDAASNDHDGWYAGGGIDWMWMKGPLANGVFGIEYQHVDLRGATQLSVLDAVNVCGANCRTVGGKEDIIRARLTVLFHPKLFGDGTILPH